MPDIVKTQLNRFVTSEPAIAATSAAAVVSYVLTQLVTSGVITDVQASTDTKLILPPATAGFLLLLGFLVRTVVRPAANYAQRLEEDVQRRINELLDAQPELKTLTVPLLEGTAGRTLLAQARDELLRAQHELLSEPVMQSLQRIAAAAHAAETGNAALEAATDAIGGGGSPVPAAPAPTPLPASAAVASRSS